MTFGWFISGLSASPRRITSVAFIGKPRLPDPEPAGFTDVAPDLVVEVLSPSDRPGAVLTDRKSTRLNSSHVRISYAVFCLKKKTYHHNTPAHSVTQYTDLLS